MTSPMQRVSSIVSSDIGNYLTNKRTWGGILYNALDNGLVGDGTTDDTSPLQKLINKAISEGGKAIYFPHGSYLVTALTNSDQVVFVGDNASFVGGFQSSINQFGMDEGEKFVGKTLYVDITNGNDSNDGGQSAPFQHINHAIQSLQKNLFTAVKIRVLAGDYTSEGQIIVENFKIQTLTITAFDGTDDVIVPNDDYKIKKIGFYNCDWVILSGFRIYNTDSDYGVYAQQTSFLRCIGVKNIESSPTSDGFGHTFNTTSHLLNCLCSNKGTVISSNNGSKVISDSWDADSVDNTTALKAQWGSQIHKKGNQPAGVNNNEHINGGTIFEEDGSLWVSRSFQSLFTADASLTGDLTFVIDMPVPPKWIKIESCQSGSAAMCSGSWSKNNGTASQSSIARNNIDGMFASFSIVHLTNDGTNTVQYEVTDVTNNLLTLTITKTGSPTGTISLSVLCGS